MCTRALLKITPMLALGITISAETQVDLATRHGFDVYDAVFLL
jgi:hypothetical protein